MSAVAVAQLARYLPSLIAWGVDSARTLIILALLVVTKVLRSSGTGRLLSARHLRELTEALEEATSPPTVQDPCQ